MEEVRASVPMHHSANTHNTPPSRHPTMCTTRGGDLPQGRSKTFIWCGGTVEMGEVG